MELIIADIIERIKYNIYLYQQIAKHLIVHLIPITRDNGVRGFDSLDVLR